MVKKVSGKGPSIKGTTAAIEPSKAVKTSKVKTVGNIAKTAEKQGAKRVKSSEHAITKADRERLFALVSEEAEQLVKKKAIPKKKKETVEKAVKMAIDSAISDDEEEES
jgi:uncharacterized protein with beta-barrel porin domain